jgi:hypothetical protein
MSQRGSKRWPEPGGICISRTVRDQIHGKLAYTFADLGEQSVKNIARPVRVYALRPAAVSDLPAPSVPTAPPISRSAVVPRLSIVVLPFTNLSTGQTEHAAVELAEARRQSGDSRYSSIARLKAVGHFGVPTIRTLFEKTFFVGLSKAAVPDE